MRSNSGETSRNVIYIIGGSGARTVVSCRRLGINDHGRFACGRVSGFTWPV